MSYVNVMDFNARAYLYDAIRPERIRLADAIHRLRRPDDGDAQENPVDPREHCSHPHHPRLEVLAMSDRVNDFHVSLKRDEHPASDGPDQCDERNCIADEEKAVDGAP